MGPGTAMRPCSTDQEYAGPDPSAQAFQVDHDSKQFHDHGDRFCAASGPLVSEKAGEGGHHRTGCSDPASRDWCNAHILMTCFHWEKSKEVWEDIFHRSGLTSLVVASAGWLPLLQASIQLNIKTMALFRNQDHLETMQEAVRRGLYTESATNQEAPYNVSRAAMIEQ